MPTSKEPSEFPHLTNFLKDLYHCSDCGYCVEAVWEERDISHICATLQSHSPGLSYSGQGYLKTARAWIEGEDLPLSSIAEHAFTCTSCGNCERICPIGLRPMEINRALRSELIARDQAPETAVTIQQSVLAEQNPLGRAFTERYNWAGDQPSVEKNANHGAIVYLPGCASAYSRPQEAQAALRLLLASGQSVDLLGDADRCCGAPLKELGFVDDAEESGRQLREALAQKSYSTLLTSGCECANSLSDSQSQTSFVAWLRSAINDKKLNLIAKSSLPNVACVDSCQATLSPETEPSGENDNQALYGILEHLGVSVNGGEKAARYALCCGAGGGAPTMHPTSSAEMASTRISDALARAESENAQLDAIVSIDPRCVAHLDLARADTDPPVYGLAEFLDKYFNVASEEI